MRARTRRLDYIIRDKGRNYLGNVQIFFGKSLSAAERKPHPDPPLIEASPRPSPKGKGELNDDYDYDDDYDDDNDDDDDYDDDFGDDGDKY